MNKNSSILSLVKQSLKKNEDWMDKNGYRGYDPHDIKGLSLFIYFLKPGHGILMKIIRKPFLWSLDYFPMLLRKIFGVPKTVNAKGMALFAKAYLNMYMITKDEKYKANALDRLQWLLDNKSKGFKNNAWGYPFDWQSGVFTPAGTPACVVCYAVNDAFWLAYKVLNEKKYLDICTGIARFFMEDLNKDVIDENTLCFSYTPLDHLHVHNANLMVAEVLIRVGKEINEESFISTGLKASNYAIKEQQADGSIFYWGNDQQYHSPGAIDHYHTGFEIRCLSAIARLTGLSSYESAWQRYYDFYLANFLLEKGDELFPKMTPKSLYPINIHSCAEAIIMNAGLMKYRPEPATFIDRITTTIIDNMQNENGSFFYMKRKLGPLVLTDKIPHIRWGQAWMYMALSEYLYHTQANTN